MKNKIRYYSFFLELIPLSIFFIVYNISDIYIAAFLTSFLSLIMLCFSRFYEKRISFFSIFSLIVAITFTIFSIYFNNPIFIKIQPTIFNGLFSITLLGGLILGRPVMKDFFSYQFDLKLKTWNILSKRWGVFFLILTISNEIVWRNFSEEQWVLYKTFISSTAVIIFMALQIPATLEGKKKF